MQCYLHAKIIKIYIKIQKFLCIFLFKNIIKCYLYTNWKKLREWVMTSKYRPFQNKFWLEEVIEDEDGNMFMDLFFPIK